MWKLSLSNLENYRNGTVVHDQTMHRLCACYKVNDFKIDIICIIFHFQTLFIIFQQYENNLINAAHEGGGCIQVPVCSRIGPKKVPI